MKCSLMCSRGSGWNISRGQGIGDNPGKDRVSPNLLRILNVSLIAADGHAIGARMLRVCHQNPARAWMSVVCRIELAAMRLPFLGRRRVVRRPGIGRSRDRTVDFVSWMGTKSTGRPIQKNLLVR